MPQTLARGGLTKRRIRVAPYFYSYNRFIIIRNNGNQDSLRVLLCVRDLKELKENRCFLMSAPPPPASIIYLSDCTPLYTTLGAPARIPSVNGFPLNASVRLEWNPPPNSENVIVDSYVVRYKRAGAPFIQILGEFVSFFPTFIVPNLSNGESYDFWVAARNRFGEGPLSPTISVSPGAAPSPIQYVRRAYHSTIAGVFPQKVGLEFTPPIMNNGATPLVFTTKYTRIVGGVSTDVSYILQESVQNNQIMRDISGGLAIKKTGEKGEYIRKEITPNTSSSASPPFVSGLYRFEVFTNNIYGLSLRPDISFVVPLYADTDSDPARATFIAPSFSTYYSSNPPTASAGIVAIDASDSSFRIRWKQYRGIGPGINVADSVAASAYSGWSYRIQYTDDRNYWYYPPVTVNTPLTAKYPEYTRAYDTTSPGAGTSDFEYSLDISRNVVNGVRYYVRYCVVAANGGSGGGDTSEYSPVTDANLSVTSVVPGKTPQPPPIFNAAVDDRMVHLFFNWPTRPPSLELTGGSPVLDYRIERYTVSRDAGGAIVIPPTPGAVFNNLIGPYYLDNFDIRTNGIEYLYRVYTRTVFGLSTLFTSVTAIPSRKSDIVYNVSAAVDSGQVTLDWFPPTNIEPGLPIVQYCIEYRVYDIFSLYDASFNPTIPPNNIVGPLSNTNTLSNTIQDMNSILVDDALWARLTTTVFNIFTYSMNLSYTIHGLINNTPYVFRIAAVSQDTARRNIVGLFIVIGNKSPYLPRPVIIGRVPQRMTNVEYFVGSGTVTIQWTSTDIRNTEGIIRFVVDYRIYGSGSTTEYSRQTFEYVNAVRYNDGTSSLLLTVIVSGLENNVLARPDTSTHSYEMVIYAENSVGYTNTTDKIDLHDDLTYTDVYENLVNLPRLVRPMTVPSLITEVRV